MAWVPKKERTEDIIKNTERLANEGDADAMAKMGQLAAYKNIPWRAKRFESVAWYRKACAADPKYAAAFYDALRDLATIDCIHESIDLALRYFRTDNEVKYRLAVALIDGYVLERNINNAMILLRELSFDTEKYKFAYIDKAMALKIADFYPIAFEDCKKFHELGIKGASKRLGAMYAKRIGTEVDVSRAMELFSEDMDSNWTQFIDCIIDNDASDRYPDAIDALRFGKDTVAAEIRSAELRKRTSGLDTECVRSMRDAASKKKPWAVKYMDDMMAEEQDLQGKYDICSALCDYSSLDVAKKVFVKFPKLETGIEPVHKAELGLLKDFLDVCEKAGVRPIADGGTLLGCVRHHGFIPWDDDFDFRMFISDIDKLERYMMTDRRDCYFVKPSLERRKYRFFSYSYVAWVDVFPIQSLLVYYDHTQPVDYPVTMADREKFPGLMGVVYRSLRDCSVLVSGPHFNEEQLFPLRKLPFEDVELWAPNDYDHTLKTFYGNYMFMPDKWHIHLDKETVENIGYRYEHRNEVSPEVKTLGHLDVAYMYAKRNQTEFAYAWAYKALQEVCPENECRTFIEGGPDYKELLEKTLVEIASHMSPLIEYDQVIDVLCKFHDEGIGPRHVWEYFLLLQEAYRLKYKKDIYFFLKKRLDGKQYDLLKRCADSLVEKDLFPGHWIYAVMYTKGAGVEKDGEKARACLEKLMGYNEDDLSVFKAVCSKSKMPLCDTVLGPTSGTAPVSEPVSVDAPKKDLVETARAYRKGTGVVKDLGRAADCYRKAIARGNKWVYKELCDVLWSMKTAEADKEYVSILMDGSKKDKPEAAGRLGKAYRDGRGVERDLAKARELFEKAALADPKWRKQLDAMD